MSVVELFQIAVKGMNQTIPGMTLVIPVGKYPRGFPRGELLNWKANGDRLYLFKPDKVLFYLVKHGAVRVVKRSGNTIEFEIINEKHESPLL